jgi:hypothetical protein
MRIEKWGPAGYREMPWKNGGGSTTELLIEPPGATLAGGFLWRISTALVPASGPFSPFPGIDRTLLLLEGRGLELDFGGHGRVLLDEPLRPVAFSGDWTAVGRLLDGPCRDFNVMADRIRIRHEVRVLRPGAEAAALPEAPTVLAYGARGTAAVGPEGCTLAAGELLRLEGGGSSALEVRALSEDAAAVLVALWPRP